MTAPGPLGRLLALLALLALVGEVVRSREPACRPHLVSMGDLLVRRRRARRAVVAGLMGSLLAVGGCLGCGVRGDLAMPGAGAAASGPHSAVALIIGYELARGWQRHFADDLAALRHAVRISRTPVLSCEVRDPAQVVALLHAFTEYVLRLREAAPRPTPCPS